VGGAVDGVATEVGFAPLLADGLTRWRFFALLPPQLPSPPRTRPPQTGRLTSGPMMIMKRRQQRKQRDAVVNGIVSPMRMPVSSLLEKSRE